MLVTKQATYNTTTTSSHNSLEYIPSRARSTYSSMTHPEPKINLKTITAHQVLSHRERMCELFQLLDDHKRHDLVVGTNERREKKLEAFKKRRDELRTELQTK
ncbi:Htl1p Ecym_1349 [Eremothecium cymbalariae DBVPG|uniref:Uncharacterized protein n=1 Tax=Eremothecium cymbalariae (strain CBS 270.75 / DBVPG 7215 / KCTC 17166 / NRRL Y-17582) TaxID=931890 RepID=G8JNB9_ERECY|nr:hypothetical protein Ecym_1349 [Eremothecium cymbalariae DBVPG\